MDRFYEIFRAGEYPQGNYDAEDIREIAENYDPSFLEVPVTLDHGWGGPAFGWVKELKAEGDRLLASFKDVTDKLVNLTSTKQYKRHSVEIYNSVEEKGLYLKAVSMLGALTPQVKGMESIEFSSFSENFPDDESATIEFDEPMNGEDDLFLSEIAGAWLDVMELGAEEFRENCDVDQDTMAGLLEGRFDEQDDEDLPSRFSDLMRQLHENDFNEEAASQFKELVTEQFMDDEGSSPEPASKGDETSEFSQEELAQKDFGDMSEAERAFMFDNMQQRTQQLEDELESERDEKKSFADENEEIKFNQRKADFTSFLEKNIKDKPKLPPKLKDKALNLFSHLDGLEAGDEDERSPLDLFKEIIEGLPEIDLEEQALKNDKKSEFSVKELADKAAEYQAEQKEKGNSVTLGQAISHIKNKK